jgi:hypothetical protein
VSFSADFSDSFSSFSSHFIFFIILHFQNAILYLSKNISILIG